MSTLDRPCEEWLERISAHLDGEATDADDRAVREHLETCPGCRAWAQAVRADAERFAAAYGGAAQQVNLRPGVMDRVAASVPRRRPWHTLVRLAGAATVFLIVAAVVLPVLLRGSQRSRRVACIANQKQITAAAIAFAEDFDGRLPQAMAWNDYLLPYLEDGREVFRCPAADRSVNAGYDYAYNVGLAGKPISKATKPLQTVLTFDADGGRVAWRHRGGAVFGYVDGHARWWRQPEPVVPVGVQAEPAAKR